MVEDKVREMVLKEFKGHIVRIENAPGGTLGVPDCLFFPGMKTWPGMRLLDDLPTVIGLELKGKDKPVVSANQRRLAGRLSMLDFTTFSLSCLDYTGHRWNLTRIGRLPEFDDTMIFQFLEYMPRTMWVMISGYKQDG